MTSVIKVKALTKRYRELKAVDSLNLDIKEGEIFGFLGPNGAGKTTTIKAMMGLLTPSKGSVRVMGKDLRRERRIATSRMGYLPENIDLYDNLTGRETLEFFADLREVNRTEVEELLEELNLQEAADRKVGDYSKGMVQRLAFAQALLGRPSLLILDEPTSGLDPEGTAQIKRMVKDYVKENRTIFFSSHILPNVQDVADRVGIIVGGKLRAVDSVDELRKRMELPTRLKITLSTDIKNVQSVLQKSPMVKDFRGEGNGLTVICDDKDKKKVLDLLEESGVDIVDFSTEEGDLEDIFMRFMGERGGGGEGDNV